MRVNWRKQTSLKPGYILDKIEQSKVVDDKGRVSFEGLLYYDAFIALMSMLDADKMVTKHLDVEKIVEASIPNVARVETLNEASLIKEINRLVDERLAGKATKFDLLTSLSVSPSLGLSKFIINGVRIEFVDEFPSRYVGRESAIEGTHLDLVAMHEGYAKTIVSVYCRDPSAAISTAMESLDLLRSFLCYFANHEMELIGAHNEPINKVILGQAHTLHYSNGEIVNGDDCWYEPQFVYIKPFQGRAHFKTNVDAYLSWLGTSPIKAALSKSMLLYVRGLDQISYNAAIVQLWAALENLVSPASRDSLAISKRCAFVCDDAKYHEQILEHLRLYRNSTVHSGVQSDRSKVHCYQLQFYFRILVRFLMANRDAFATLDEVINFLDLPTSKESLIRRKAALDKALVFRRYD